MGSSGLFLPALLFASRTDKASLALTLLGGVIALWSAYAWAVDRDGAWRRVVDISTKRPETWSLITGSFGPQETASAGGSGERAFTIAALIVWAIVQLVVGVIGFVAILR
jgi:hypothetical protein